MFDRVRVPAARENVVAPLLVCDFFVIDVLVENPSDGRNDILREMVVPIRG